MTILECKATVAENDLLVGQTSVVIIEGRLRIRSLRFRECKIELYFEKMAVCSKKLSVI